MKKLLLSLLCVLPLTAMDSGLVKVQKQSVFAPHDLGDVDLYHGSRGFSVLKDGEFKPVQFHNVDAKLRKVTPEQLTAFQAAGYLALKRMSNGEYAVDGKVRGLGGGYFGAQAGFWTGKFVTHLTAQAVYGLVAAGATVVTLNPAVGVAVFAAMEATCAVPVEAASNVIGLGCGLAGGVASGGV